eukprot:gene6305-12760_t
MSSSTSTTSSVQENSFAKTDDGRRRPRLRSNSDSSLNSIKLLAKKDANSRGSNKDINGRDKGNNHNHHYLILDCSFVTGMDGNAIAGLLKLKQRLLGRSQLPTEIVFAGLQPKTRDMFEATKKTLHRPTSSFDERTPLVRPLSRTNSFNDLDQFSRRTGTGANQVLSSNSNSNSNGNRNTMKSPKTSKFFKHSNDSDKHSNDASTTGVEDDFMPYHSDVNIALQHVEESILDSVRSPRHSHSHSKHKLDISEALRSKLEAVAVAVAVKSEVNSYHSEKSDSLSLSSSSNTRLTKDESLQQQFTPRGHGHSHGHMVNEPEMRQDFAITESHSWSEIAGTGTGVGMSSSWSQARDDELLGVDLGWGKAWEKEWILGIGSNSSGEGSSPEDECPLSPSLSSSFLPIIRTSSAADMGPPPAGNNNTTTANGNIRGNISVTPPQFSSVTHFIENSLQGNNDHDNSNDNSNGSGRMASTSTSRHDIAAESSPSPKETESMMTTATAATSHIPFASSDSPYYQRHRDREEKKRKKTTTTTMKGEGKGHGHGDYSHSASGEGNATESVSVSDQGRRSESPDSLEDSDVAEVFPLVVEEVDDDADRCDTMGNVILSSKPPLPHQVTQPQPSSVAPTTDKSAVTTTTPKGSMPSISSTSTGIGGMREISPRGRNVSPFDVHNNSVHSHRHHPPPMESLLVSEHPQLQKQSQLPPVDVAATLSRMKPPPENVVTVAATAIAKPWKPTDTRKSQLIKTNNNNNSQAPLLLGSAAQSSAKGSTWGEHTDTVHREQKHLIRRMLLDLNSKWSRADEPALKSLSKYLLAGVTEVKQGQLMWSAGQSAQQLGLLLKGRLKAVISSNRYGSHHQLLHAERVLQVVLPGCFI